MQSTQLYSGRRGVQALLGCTALAAALAVSPHAQAQQSTPGLGSADQTTPPGVSASTRPGAPAPATASNEIVVTGSRIRGAAPVGASVITESQADIISSGGVTTDDAIKLVPQVSALGADESHRGAQGGSGNIFYSNQVNLRGLGPQATLLLVDGHRVPASGTAGLSPDPSILPSIAVDRVEVVADGASALYGSDAVAGVVNLITRKNFEGLEVRAQAGDGTDFNQTQFGFITGKHWDRGQIMFAYEHDYHSMLSGFDRSYFRNNLTGLGGANYSPNQCNPGNIVVGGQTYAIPAGGVTPATAATLIPGTVNQCDTYAGRSILPRQNRDSLTFAGSYELSPTVHLFGEGWAYHRAFYLYSPTSFPAQTLNVPSTNAYFVLPPGAPAGTKSETVNYLIPGLGTGIPMMGSINSFQVTAGADAKLWGDWNAELSTSFGEDYDYAGYAQVNAANLTAALASANPATALDPFAAGFGPNKPAVINSLFDNVLHAPGENTQAIFQGKVDGTLFHLPGGAVKAAAGFEYRYERLVTGSTSGPAASPTAIRFYPDRSIGGVFGEVLVPITSPSNNIPLVRRLDVDAAVRHEEYSDVGGTTNPKIGVNWSPVDGVTLKGTWGTSFRAPPLGNLVSTNASLSVFTVFDPFTNANAQVLENNSADPNIKPETATTWTMGVDFNPTWLRSFRANIDYFNVDYRGQIQSVLGVTTILQQYNVYSNLITLNPSQAFLAPYLATLPLRNGALPSVVAAYINASATNLGITQTTGFDFDMSYRWATANAGDFVLGLTGTYFDKFRVSQASGVPLQGVLGTLNYPQRYSFLVRGTWNYGPVNVVTMVNQIAGYSNTAVTPAQKVTDYTTVNLFASYTLREPSFAPWLKGTKLFVDASNLFDAAPPFVNIAGGYDPQAASAIGRVVSIGFDKTF